MEEFAVWRLEQTEKKLANQGKIKNPEKNFEITLKSIKLKEYKMQKQGIVETYSIREKLEEEVRRWRALEIEETKKN